MSSPFRGEPAPARECNPKPRRLPAGVAIATRDCLACGGEHKTRDCPSLATRNDSTAKTGQDAAPDRPAPQVGAASVELEPNELEATICALIIARQARPAYAATFDALLAKYGRERDIAAAWRRYERAHADARAKRAGDVVTFSVGELAQLGADTYFAVFGGDDDADGGAV